MLDSLSLIAFSNMSQIKYTVFIKHITNNTTVVGHSVEHKNSSSTTIGRKETPKWSIKHGKTKLLNGTRIFVLC